MPEKDAMSRLCKGVLWYGKDKYTEIKMRSKFDLYKHCVGDFNDKLSHCQPQLYSACSNSTVRAIKTVRLVQSLYINSLMDMLKSFPIAIHKLSR